MTRLMAAAAIAVLLSAGPVLAQGKIQIGCTATSDCGSAMVAIDEGIFKKHGLEAEMVLIGINSNIPAAILSNSIQIGGPTSTVFLQAADGGLDLVAVGGATVMSPVTNNNVAAFVRNGITINEPKDFIGKKVGAPGLGAFLHVLFVKWLVEKGVDPKRVNFVEVTFPTMMDIVKSGSVDAVLTGEPFVTRMTNAGLGTVGARYAAELGRTEPIIFYAASREWADEESRASSRSSAPRSPKQLPSSTATGRRRPRRSRSSPSSRLSWSRPRRRTGPNRFSSPSSWRGGSISCRRRRCCRASSISTS